MSICEEGIKVFDKEIIALEKTRDSLDETFEKIVCEIELCRGKVVLSGMGKPGHIAKKLAATFSSLGIPAVFLHPGEAMHGDLGMLSREDIVILISYSGESDEILRIIPNLRFWNIKMIAITGNAESNLAKAADIVQVLPKFEEACSLGLAPTSSTTAVLCYGDALAIAASTNRGYSAKDFGMNHPAGSLGKKLTLKVENLMKDFSSIKVHATVKDAIIEMNRSHLGAVAIVDAEGNLVGIFTGGDLTRLLEKGEDIYSIKIDNVMTKCPSTISADEFAVDGMVKMLELNITVLPVLKENRPVGILPLSSIRQAGLV